MNFVSIEFAYLFAVIFFLLWAIPSPLVRKIIILSASCYFYAYWDWRFLGLLILITVVDYEISRLLLRAKTSKGKNYLLFASVILNLTVLGIFKYLNFFIDNLNIVFSRFGWEMGAVSIILPIGISFYTFETLSYVIDVYRGNTEPADSLLDYAVFLTFFPRLVAGPIMRASQFLPQLKRGVVINPSNFITGAQLFAQGLVKKVLVADRLSVGIDLVYSNPARFSPASVWLAVFAYSIQIYFDFSGYSDMAMGVAKTFGFDLAQNFHLPYVSQSITEFWRRWHISLSTWLRDYLYIPLGGNRKGKVRTYLNLMVTMLLGGLWHGASWNFVVWGGLHGIYLATERLLGWSHAKSEARPFNWIKALFIFVLVSVTWVFFRSSSWQTTEIVLSKLFFISTSGVHWQHAPALAFVPIIIIGGWIMRARNFEIPKLTLEQPYAIPLLMAEYFWVYLFFPANINPFIYFQF
ncbi:D-alanyl-lipoteichoic acid acyltransferase DltB [Candidatus Denitrolinea symbiosum]|jgi:alginate O-acetyltransferase complex protein AlgI|nr:D-alanyl-lipoteichoic acid acyltransferase DltB [Candidatus Denitrolinea symbiosum]